ncbi:hypothetical protein KUH03_19390 [Sphingobacterium sp. E70]|uniref:hypothetical protein n=1 Tax=Sphingobacterium sp. E70 TaxID=2853439 RepID=UPI00211BE148|nr:hypothetical protein [Sphingobacterium sp. E70]ULT28501.1 hypothetical protein KUH03_19390 [Sphingobacterium sp. E70]
MGVIFKNEKIAPYFVVCTFVLSERDNTKTIRRQVLMWERTGLTEKKQVKRILNMNIVQLKLKNASVEQKPLFTGKTKKTSAKNVKYILSNNNVFIENHEYFGVFTKSILENSIKHLLINSD